MTENEFIIWLQLMVFGIGVVLLFVPGRRGRTGAAGPMGATGRDGGTVSVDVFMSILRDELDSKVDALKRELRTTDPTFGICASLASDYESNLRKGTGYPRGADACPKNLWGFRDSVFAHLSGLTAPFIALKFDGSWQSAKEIMDEYRCYGTFVCTNGKGPVVLNLFSGINTKVRIEPGQYVFLGKGDTVQISDAETFERTCCKIGGRS